jgi:hypothetical protein
MNKLHEMYKAIHDEAHAAGMAAGTAKVPVPMIVGESKGFVGAAANKIDYAKPTYYVASGVCGFAWVVIENGRSGYARWVKKNVKNSHKNYYGGWAVWVNEFGQSMEQKEAYADAYAKVLKEHGIEAMPQSRMD